MGPASSPLGAGQALRTRELKISLDEHIHASQLATERLPSVSVLLLAPSGIAIRRGMGQYVMNGYRVLFGGVFVVLAGLIGGTGVGVASSAPGAAPQAAANAAVVKANTFEGCTAGQPVTASSSAAGGDPFTSVNPGALQYSTAQAVHGKCSVDLTGTVSTDGKYAVWSGATTPDKPVFVRSYIYMNELPSGDTGTVRFLRFSGAGGVGGYVAVNDVNPGPQGTVALENATTTHLSVSKTALQIHTWYRIEVKYDNALQSITTRLYAGDSPTLIEQFSASGASAPVTDVGFGQEYDAPTNNGGNFFIDDVAYGTDWLGPAVPAVSAPTVSAVSPNTGPAAGGTPVTVTGTNFTSGATVAFGGVAATNVQITSPTSLTATSPPGSSTVHVTVTGTGGSSTGGPGDQFTYAAAGPVPGAGPADLSLRLSTPFFATPGPNSTTVVTVTNNGPTVAGPTTTTFVPFGGETIAPADSNGKPTQAQGPGQLVFTTPVLAVGQSISYTVAVNSPQTFHLGGVFAYSFANNADPNIFNNVGLTINV